MVKVSNIGAGNRKKGRRLYWIVCGRLPAPHIGLLGSASSANSANSGNSVNSANSANSATKSRLCDEKYRKMCDQLRVDTVRWTAKGG